MPSSPSYVASSITSTGREPEGGAGHPSWSRTTLRLYKRRGSAARGSRAQRLAPEVKKVAESAAGGYPFGLGENGSGSLSPRPPFRGTLRGGLGAAGA